MVAIINNFFLKSLKSWQFQDTKCLLNFQQSREKETEALTKRETHKGSGVWAGGKEEETETEMNTHD